MCSGSIVVADADALLVADGTSDNGSSAVMSVFGETDRVCWIGCAIIWKMRCGVEPRVMTVVTPDAVASSAAISLVTIPPVPSDEPAVATDTVASWIKVKIYQHL